MIDFSFQYLTHKFNFHALGTHDVVRQTRALARPASAPFSNISLRTTGPLVPGDMGMSVLYPLSYFILRRERGQLFGPGAPWGPGTPMEPRGIGCLDASSPLVGWKQATIGWLEARNHWLVGSTQPPVGWLVGSAQPLVGWLEARNHWLVAWKHATTGRVEKVDLVSLVP